MKGLDTVAAMASSAVVALVCRNVREFFQVSPQCGSVGARLCFAPRALAATRAIGKYSYKTPTRTVVHC